MSETYRFLGWEMSLYSGKVRAYLRYKGIPYREDRPTIRGMSAIKRHTGAQVIPVVVTPQGEWLQDTSAIIDELEQRFPQSPVVPETPRQRLAAYLIEAWGDEFWLASAMHYRWSFPENYKAIFRPESGDNLLPFAPRFLKNRLAKTVAGQMQSFLPALGVTPAQARCIEEWSERICDALDAHFAQHPYLFGTRPSLGDFGLIAPLYAHLGRDPYPARTLIAPRKHLAAWVQRMQHPQQPQRGAFLADDAIPETLQPLFASIFGEFWVQLAGTLVELQKDIPALKPGRGFRRALGSIEVPMSGHVFRMAARPYSLWMAQRALDAHDAMQGAARQSVDAWLGEVGGLQAMQLPIPRLKRMALHVGLA